MAASPPPQRAFRVGIALAEIAVIAVAATCGFWIARVQEASEPINTALGCVETVVTGAQQPTGPGMADGGSISFRDDIAPHHGTSNQQILGVYVAPGAYAIANVGDRVRVCLLNVPAKSVNSDGLGCDPARDIRGRGFIVYDRATGEADVYSNGEHSCGGA